MFLVLSRLYLLQNLLSRFVTTLIPPFLVHNLGKYFAIKKAFYLTGLEGLKGDYLEFGVFTGSSFACALQASGATRINYAHKKMNFYGFDSFDGFGDLSENDKHPFYKNLNFKTSFQSVERRLMRVSNSSQNVILTKGFFSETCKNVLPAKYGVEKASVIMMDNDTYEAALDCFRFCESTLQEGTIFIIDDYFSYKGNAERGVAGAFLKWRKDFSKAEFRLVGNYGMGGVMYIVSKLDE